MCLRGGDYNKHAGELLDWAHISKITNNSILSQFFRHRSGNEKLRELARAACAEYIRSSKKQKSALSRRLVRATQNRDPPGRFLRKSRITSAWEEVDKEYAREKASQCKCFEVACSLSITHIVLTLILCRKSPQACVTPSKSWVRLRKARTRITSASVQ